jgi:hypothetical protein
VSCKPSGKLLPTGIGSVRAGVPNAAHGAFMLASPVQASPRAAGPVAAGTRIDWGGLERIRNADLPLASETTCLLILGVSNLLSEENEFYNVPQAVTRNP